MEVIVVLLPITIILGVLFIAGFVWMTVKGQYDDLETPKHKMLLDDKYISMTKKESEK